MAAATLCPQAALSLAVKHGYFGDTKLLFPTKLLQMLLKRSGRKFHISYIIGRIRFARNHNAL